MAAGQPHLGPGMSVTDYLGRWVAKDSGPYPLSLRQAERIVRDECVCAAHGSALQVPMTLSYAFGPVLDWARLRSSLESVCGNSWPLRSTFPRLPDGRRGLQVTEGSGLASDYAVFADEQSAQSWLDGRQAEPLDLFSGPLVRLLGARVRPTGETWVQLTIEHMVFDGLSEAVLMARLRDAYNGLAWERPDLTGTAYREFVARQWELVDSGEGQRRLALWKSRLSAGQARPGFSLTSAYSQEETTCGWLCANLPESVAGDLATVARAHRTTPFSLIVAAVLLTMRRYAAEGPLGFVCPIANRSSRKEFRAIGNFSDYMVVRTDQVAAESDPATAVSVARKAVAESLANHYPWSTLVRELEPESFVKPDPRPHLSLSYLGEAAAGWLRDFRLEGVQQVRIREARSPAQWPPHPLTLSVRRVGGLRIDLGYRGLADPAAATGFLSDCTAELRRIAGAAAR